MIAFHELLASEFEDAFILDRKGMIIAHSKYIMSFKMSPSSLGGGKQTTTAGEHISQLVATRS